MGHSKGGHFATHKRCHSSMRQILPQNSFANKKITGKQESLKIKY
jgi:hypothetical protein